MPNNFSNNTRVTFDEPGMGYGGGAPRGPRQSWLTKLLIQLGLAKDAKQAAIVLIILGIAALILTVLFWPRGGGYEIVPQPGLGISLST